MITCLWNRGKKFMFWKKRVFFSKNCKAFNSIDFNLKTWSDTVSRFPLNQSLHPFNDRWGLGLGVLAEWGRPGDFPFVNSKHYTVFLSSNIPYFTCNFLLAMNLRYFEDHMIDCSPWFIAGQQVEALLFVLKDLVSS